MAETENATPVRHVTRRALLGEEDLMYRRIVSGLAGLTFGGNRDLYSALGYKRDITPADYRARYRRSGLAKRIIESFPRATWRGGGEIIEDESTPEITAFEEAFINLNVRLNVWNIFNRADSLARLGRYSVILLGLPGDLDKPAPRVSKPEQLFYIQPFSEEDAKISNLVTDSQDERFGFPERYQINRIEVDPRKKTERFVHWTRCIHVVEGALDENLYGIPALESVWNLIDDIEKVVGGGAEAFWIRAHQGLHFDIDPEVFGALAPGAEDKIKEEIDNYINGMRRTIQSTGMKVNSLGSDVADFKGPAEAIMDQISAATGIPQRILMGSERGQLASSQDRSNWAERVMDRRMEFAGPMIARPFIERLIGIGALPTPTQYEIRWPQAQILDEKEKADVARIYAEMNAKNPKIVVTRNEIRDRVLLLGPIEDVEDFDEADDVKPVANPGAPTPEPEPELDAEGNPVVAAVRAATKSEILRRRSLLLFKNKEVESRVKGATSTARSFLTRLVGGGL